MQEADHNITTPLPAAELSKLYRSVSDVVDAHDMAMTRASKAMDALDAMIFDRPIHTLADAAALAVHAAARLDSVQSESELAELRRAFGRIAVVTAAAAGIELDDIGNGDSAKFLSGVTAAPVEAFERQTIARVAEMLRKPA